MVAHLVRLKLALLRNIFRRSRAQAIGVILGLLYGTGVVVLVTIGLAALRTDADAARIIIPLFGAVLVLAWTIVPLFSFGSDPTLDPGRFATFAIPLRDLAVGLIAAALIGLPAIATIVMSVGVVVAWSVTPAAAVAGVVGAAVGVLTAVTASRWVSALASNAISSRRGRDLMGVLGLLLLVVFGPVVSLVANSGRGLADVLTAVANVVAWTPLGWAWAAPGDIATGSYAAGLARLLLAIGLLALLGVLWARALRRQVENPLAVARFDSKVAADGDLGLLGRGPDTITGAVAGQVITYWRRDPRYQAGLLLTPFVPLFLLVPSFVGDVDWLVLLMGPVLGFLVGFGEHNSVAYESDAFWLRVATGTPGRPDRRARLVPDIALALVLLPVYSVVGCWIGGRFDLLPVVLGVSIALLGGGFAISSVLSVVLPYPVPGPGESPFSAPPGAAGITLGAQTVASVGTALLAGPVLLLGWLALQGSAWAVWPTLAAGIMLGGVLAELGIRVGGRLFDRRGPELLSALSRN